METKESESARASDLPGGGRMVLVMGFVGLVASFLLVATYIVTTPYIDANLEAYLQQAIGDVLPNAVQTRTYVVSGDDLQPETDPAVTGERVYAGFDADGNLSGIAIPAQGQGYQDVISLIYGYSTDCTCIIGMKVLESRETPGLGDKIEKDPAFLSNFDRLAVRFSAAEKQITGLLELTKKGQKTSDWQIEAISGATISSTAITDILNASNANIIPIIEKNKDRLSPSADTVEP
jgi:electron transport complex protein RnfG